MEQALTGQIGEFVFSWAFVDLLKIFLRWDNF